MKAPMPQSVKVGCHTYAVVRKPKGVMGTNIGDCRFDEVEIWILERLRRSKAKEILLHETLHACTHPSLNGNKGYTDEEFVEGVAPVLLEVLQDNPELIAYLTT